MEKESRIDEIMESTKGMKPAEADPFLFEKISFQIEKKERNTKREILFLKSWALAASLVIIINFISLAYLLKDKPGSRKEMGYHALSKEMGLPEITNY